MKTEVGVPGKILASLIILVIISCQAALASPRVEKGVLDLRHIQQGDEFSVRMNGEWEFYFGTFIYGIPGRITDTLSPACYGKVPGFWNDYTIDGQNLPKFGFGTYRALILLPPGYLDRMGFDIPVFDSSFELSINGVTMARNGTPARSRAESIPAYEPQFIIYAPKSDTLELLIRISNWEHRRGGFWMPLKTGTFNTIRSNFTNQWFLSIATSGILFASFLFFFIFYLLDRRDKKLLMFAILVLCFALRPFMSAPYLVSIFELKNWYVIVRSEYLILLMMIASAAWLAWLIYPTRWFRRFAVGVHVVFLIGTVLVLVLPVYHFAYSVWVIQAITLTILLYATAMSIKGALKKNGIDLLYLIAFLILGIGFIADLALANALEENQQQYILPFMMLVFVMIQATLLMRDYIKQGREREKLSVQLEELNRNLESRVWERTRELQDKTVELNARNELIADQNKKLSDSISLKNKIFSVISHDLRSPVVNILYSLYMLKEEESRDKAESLADSCIQYSQQLIALLENMLVWGRGQEDVIRYSPAENDLADIILTNISIFKDSADRKNISMNFTQIGRSKGWFDRDLIDIVIRNLISNAIKYTNRGGKITIHLRGKEEPGGGVSIKICDDGVGITEERQKRLFTGNEIETTQGTDSEKGTGIGLKLVHELVTISKGSVTIQSTPGSGSCFTVILPGPESDRAGIGLM